MLKVKTKKNWSYYFIGAGILILNYIRHKLFGYKTPRTFSIKQISRAVDYDFSVTEEWIRYLSDYVKQPNYLKNKVILELGPGPDLGIGLIFLASGIRKYIALDINKLATSAPLEFYNKLFCRISDKYPECDVNYLKQQLHKCYKGEDAALSYIVDRNFSVSKIADKIDIVFSQATFEHFTDVEGTICEITNVVIDGGILVSEIDLKTHARWIRDKDPLNIYRYNDIFWNLFRFEGSPNRVRSFEYERLLKKYGWFDIKIEPTNVLKDRHLAKVKPSLYRRFRNINTSEMKILSFILMAKKGLS